MKFSAFAVAVFVALASPGSAYLSSISGGSKAKAPQRNSAFLPRKPMGSHDPNPTPSSPTYERFVDHVATPGESVSANAAPTSTSYLNQMGGGNVAPMKPASYAPGGGKPYAPTTGSGMASYLDNVVPSSNGYNPASEQTAVPAAPTSASYLNQMGGGNVAPVKAASYAPGGGKPYAATAGTGMASYLDNVVPSSNGYNPVPEQAAVPAAPTSASYFNQMGGGNVAPVKAASYAPGGGKPYAATAGTGMASYLDNVAPTANGYDAANGYEAAAAPTSASYLNQMGGGNVAPVKAASYAPGGGKPYAATGGTGMTSYLDNVAPAANGYAVNSGYSEPATPAAEAAPASGSYLEQMGGGKVAPMKAASYAPGGGKPYAATAGTGMASYLDNVAPPANGYAVAPTYSEPAAPVADAAPTSASYLAQMGGGKVAPIKAASYAPGGGKPYAATTGTGMASYLDNVAPPANGYAVAPTYSEPAAPAADGAPTSASYLEQMGGAGFAPVKPASYAPGGGKPYAATAGTGMTSYLDNVAPAANGYAVAPTYSEPAAPVAEAAPTSASYLEQMGGAVGTPKQASYAPAGGKVYAATGGTGMTSYLDNVGNSAAFVYSPVAEAPVEEVPVAADVGTMIAQDQVLTAINDLNTNMNANQEATLSVLHDINDSVKTLAENPAFNPPPNGGF